MKKNIYNKIKVFGTVGLMCAILAACSSAGNTTTVVNVTNSQPVSEKQSEKEVSEVISEKKSEKPSEIKSEKPSEKKSEKPSEKKSEKPSEKKSEKPSEEPKPKVEENYFGSADRLEGKVVIISIFGNDTNSQWENTDADYEIEKEMKKNLKIATKWITDSVSNYGKKVEFVYDYDTNPDLYYEADFDALMVDSKNYYLERDFIMNEIDTEGIRKKYGTDNVVYMFFFDTAYENDVNPWTYSSSAGEFYRNESVNIFTRFKNLITPPATVAHELLHCFGAPDLYYSNDKIPQEYVDYCVSSKSKDIMYTVNMGDQITSVFTDLDAYYVGYTNQCAEVDKWGLGKNEILKKEESTANN